MKKLSWILVLTISFAGAFAQDPVPFLKKNGKYIFVDSATMKPVGGIEFDDFQKLESSVGLLKVKVNGLWGFADKKGKLAVPAKYDDVGYFVEDRAGIIKNGKKGFVDPSGNEIVPPRYDEVLNYTDGMSAVSENDKCGFADLSGKVVIPVVYDMVLPFEGGVAVFSSGPEVGLINKAGKIVTQKSYEGIYQYKDGIYGVRFNGKWGFIDRTGKEIVPVIYDSIFSPFREGFAGVLKKDTGAGFVDLHGKEITAFQYKNLDSFVNDLASVMLVNKWGYIDKTGREVIPPKYEASGYFSADGLASVRLNHKWGYIDRNGKEVIPFIYNEVMEFERGRALVVHNGKMGVIDKTGKDIIPPVYERIHTFLEGLAAVAESTNPDKTKLSASKLGYMDTTGKLVIPFRYDDAQGFHNGLSAVSINDKWGIINRSGLEIAPLKYDYIFYSYNPLYDEIAGIDLNIMYMFGKLWPGFILVELNGDHFLLDYSGREYREKR